jgi:hypothetical protein
MRVPKRIDRVIVRWLVSAEGAGVCRANHRNLVHFGTRFRPGLFRRNKRRSFHLQADDQIVPDEGVDLLDLSAAEQEAILAARELLAEAIKSGRPEVPEIFLIADEEGRALAIVPFTAVLPRPPEEVGVSEDCHRDSRPGMWCGVCAGGVSKGPVHAGGFFFGDCRGRRAVEGVAFVPTFFGAFAAAGRVKREAHRCSKRL